MEHPLDQAIPSNTAQAPPPIHFRPHARSTNVGYKHRLLPLVELLEKVPVTHRPTSSATKRTAAPIGPESVTHMLEIAKSPSARDLYTKTCGYEKREGVRERLAARDSDDVQMEKAVSIFLGDGEDSGFGWDDVIVSIGGERNSYSCVSIPVGGFLVLSFLSFRFCILPSRLVGHVSRFKNHSLTHAPMAILRRVAFLAYDCVLLVWLCFLPYHTYH